MNRNHARKGFTLIELLVVILILGILVAVALPAYLSSVRDARLKTANTNARAIATAIQSKYVSGGGVTYAGLGTNAVLNADMGGAVPTNPCTLTNSNVMGGAGYTYSADAAGATITPVVDASKCDAATPIVLGTGGP